MQRLFATVDRVVATPSRSVRGRGEKKGRRAIVTLGYALNPDGSMNDILLGRLETTRALAQADPAALVIPHRRRAPEPPDRGQADGGLAGEKGIDRSRIIEENYATSTVENALYSGYALARHEIEYATLVSSASHVRRGQTLLEIACWQMARPTSASTASPTRTSPSPPWPRQARRSCSASPRRPAHLWPLGYRSAPLIER